MALEELEVLKTEDTRGDKRQEGRYTTAKAEAMQHSEPVETG